MVITLLSDFGDVYPASMKGVILEICPDANIVDISHQVPRHNISSGAFILMTTAKYFPSGTIHIAVVDPGVGTDRRAIAVKASSSRGPIHYFVGPDNGLLIPAATDIGKIEVHKISNKDLFRQDESNTFHGRDIFAPVGAHIAKGLNINEVGEIIPDYVRFDFGMVRRMNDSICGKVIYVDSFGNIITNIPGKSLNFDYGDRIEIEGKQIVFARSYGSCEKGEPLALLGSHGYLEIAVNMGDAAGLFEKKEGNEIIIWHTV